MTGAAHPKNAGKAERRRVRHEREKSDGRFYPEDWPEIAERVKAEAGRKCVRCRWGNDARTGHVLTVHHLDGDKANCAWFNLIALCQRCHLRIQGRVKMNRTWLFEHSDWFKPYVAGYQAHRFGLKEDRAWVMANLEALLALGREA